MVNHIIAVLCEGPHDIAFITRILKFNEFKSFQGTKLKDYPKPIDSFLKTEVLKTNVDDLNLVEIRQVLLPLSTLKKGSNYLLFYSLNGDSKKAERQRLLKDFYNFIPKENEISVLPEDTKLSVIYFFDADEKGVKTRIAEINEEINQTIGVSPFTDHLEIRTFNNLNLGAYIFSSSDGNGKLEDLVIPLMTDQNEGIFQAANSFLDSQFNESRKIKYDRDKSLIGLVGQLQLSGCSNVVHIEKTDYISIDNIKANDKCLEIASYFSKFI